MKNLITLSLLFFSSCQLLFAQDLQLLDSETNDPVDFAYIIVDDKSYISDEDGKFSITSKVNTNGIINIQHLNYEDMILSVEEISETKLIYLQNMHFSLPTVVVRASMGRNNCSTILCGGCCIRPSVDIFENKEEAVLPVQKIELSVYPNPFVEEVFIKFSNQQAMSGTIRLVNNLGNVLMEQEIQTDEENHIHTLTQLDRLINGNYFVQFLEGNKVTSTNIIKLNTN